MGSTTVHLSSCCLIQHTEYLGIMRDELAEVEDWYIWVLQLGRQGFWTYYQVIGVLWIGKRDIKELVCLLVWCDFCNKKEVEEWRKERSLQFLGKKSMERRFDRKLSMFGTTCAFRIEILSWKTFAGLGFEPTISRSAQSGEKECCLLTCHTPCMVATDHWKDWGASSGCYSPLSRLLMQPLVHV